MQTKLYRLFMQRDLVMSIFIVFLLTFLIRILFIVSGGVSFHYDMARDAFVVNQILSGDLKLIGPPTSTPGLYHGVLYYYLLSPFYFLGKGNPVVVSFFLSLINSLTAIVIMLSVNYLFKKKILVIVSGLFFAIAAEASQYGPWLSNPGPAMFTAALFFLSLIVWQKKNKLGLPAAAFFAGISTQFQFFLIYLFILIPIFGYIFKPFVTFRNLMLAAVLTIITLSTFIISAVKFNNLFAMIQSLIGITGVTQFNFRTQFTDSFLNYLNRFADVFINNFFPINVFIGGLLAFIVLINARKNKLILFFLLSSLAIFLFGGHGSAFVNVGLILPAVLGVILLINEIYKNKKSLAIIIVGLIFVSNTYAIYKINPQGQLGLVIPKTMNLKNQLNLLDKTYKIADGKDFSINTLTLPLWINTTWAYLYGWYGKQRYGYLPSFYGRDQIGQLGVDVLFKVDQPQKISFFIIEPPEGIPSHFLSQEIDSENGKTTMIDEYLFGQIKLQLRTPKTATPSSII